MTDEEGMTILRDWAISAEPGWPGGTNGEFCKWLLPHFTRMFCNKSFNILDEMRRNGYLGGKANSTGDVVDDIDLRNKTRQARRQYAYDCLRFGQPISLDPKIG